MTSARSRTRESCCQRLAARLGIEALVDQTVALGERPGAANAGAKVMTLVSAMALGADCIDDCDVLRAGRTGQVLGYQVAAPSTLGTFLRSFTFGHVRQLDRVLAEALTRAWAAGAGPGEGGWSSTSTASSVRCTAGPVRGGPSAAAIALGRHKHPASAFRHASEPGQRCGLRRSTLLRVP
jgi:hypothetical protein